MAIESDFARLAESMSARGVAEAIDEMRELQQRSSTEDILYRAVEEASVGFQIINPDGYIIYSNKAVGEMFQCSPDDYNGKHMGEMFVDAEIAKKQLLPSLIEHGRWEGGFTAMRASGETFPARFRGAIVKDNQGQLVALVGNVRDVADAELGRYDLELRSMLLDSANDTVLVHDFDLNVIYINEAGYKDRGYTRDEFMALSLKDIVVPETVARIEERLEILRRDGSIVFESAHIKKDGSIMDVEVHSRLVELNQRSMIIAVIRNVTENKLAEREVRKSERQLRNVLEKVQQIAVTLDIDGNIIFCNDFLLELTGWRREEIIHRNWFEVFIDPERQGEIEQVYGRILAAGSPAHYENHILDRNGNELLIRFSNVFLHDESGKVIGVTSLGEDVSERRRAKELSDALNDINAAINSSLDFEQIMKSFVSLSTRAIGSETAVVAIREKDLWELKYTHGFTEDIAGVRFTDEQSPHVVLATENKKTVAINDAYNDDRVDLEVMKKYEVRSALVTPLLVKEEAIGALVFNYHSAQTDFSALQIDFAEKLGAALSLALENSRLYLAQESIADILQEALLTIPTRIEGIDFAHLYRSATETAKVGGDFYDLFEIEHGKVGVTIGDVSGKGLQAATLTSLIKNTIRAYAYEQLDPATVLSKTNEVVTRHEHAPFMFVTAFFAILDINSGVITYALAGHPPPIIKRDRSAGSPASKGSMALGVFLDVEYRNINESLRPGDILFLYTDGVVEARGGKEMFHEEKLAELISNSRERSAGGLTEEIFSEISEFAGGQLSDDVAILAVSLEKAEQEKTSKK